MRNLKYKVCCAFNYKVGIHLGKLLQTILKHNAQFTRPIDLYATSR
jgi:hypothetical protein